MYKLIYYKKEYKNQWDKLVNEYGTIFHTIEWNEVLEETFNFKPLYLMAVDEKEQIRSLVPLAIGRNMRFKKIGVSLPFVNYMDICSEDTDSANFLNEQIHPLLSARDLDYIELRYKDFNMELQNCNHNEDNYTFILPLEGGEEKVMELSSSSNRNHIRKTYKNEWYKISHDWNKINDFYKVYSHTMKRLGSPCPSIKFFNLIKEKLGRNVTLLTVLDSQTEEVIGGMFLFTWRDTVYYQWGGALETYNKKHINNYMYWEAVKFSIINGYKFLDLGRSQKDSGTYTFKSHFGAEPQKLTYYKLARNLEKIKHVEKKDVEWAIGLWKKTPKLLTDNIGKTLIKYVMP